MPRSIYLALKTQQNKSEPRVNLVLRTIWEKTKGPLEFFAFVLLLFVVYRYDTTNATILQDIREVVALISAGQPACVRGHDHSHPRQNPILPPEPPDAPPIHIRHPQHPPAVPHLPPSVIRQRQRHHTIVVIPGRRRIRNPARRPDRILIPLHLRRQHIPVSL